MANVGDSTVIACINGKAEVLSKDHKASDPEEVQRIERQGGAVLSGRINGYLAVGRALGDYNFRPFVSEIPFIRFGKLPVETKFVIIASDGLWDVVSHQEAVDAVIELESPSIMAHKLGALALRKRTRDNVTCGVILFDRMSSAFF